MKCRSIIAISFTCAALAAQAQTAAKPEGKPAPKAAAKPAAAAAKPAPAQTLKLSEAEFEIAKKIHVGDIPCELGATVKVTPHEREGFFKLSLKGHNFVMQPVESRTGAIRLEDPAQGAVWLQLANKSMLMSQKLGQRLADDCQSKAQVDFAESMKTKPPVDLLGAQPAAAGASGAAK